MDNPHQSPASNQTNSPATPDNLMLKVTGDDKNNLLDALEAKNITSVFINGNWLPVSKISGPVSESGHEEWTIMANHGQEKLRLVVRTDRSGGVRIYWSSLDSSQNWADNKLEGFYFRI